MIDTKWLRSEVTREATFATEPLIRAKNAVILQLLDELDRLAYTNFDRVRWLLQHLVAKGPYGVARADFKHCVHCGADDYEDHTYSYETQVTGEWVKMEQKKEDCPFIILTALLEELNR